MSNGNGLIYEYEGKLFPDYLKRGNACEHIAVTAKFFCRGDGLDVGAGRWPLPGSTPVELVDGGNAYDLPEPKTDAQRLRGGWDYVFSSHCLEHLNDPVAALEHWRDRLRPGGVLFLYLPHPDMTYWLPQHCRKHRHSWTPDAAGRLVADVGFRDVIRSERDLYWSFAIVGFKP